MDDLTRKRIVESILKYVAISTDELDAMLKHAEFREYQKNDFLTREGTTENYVYFIIEGIVRNYYLHKGDDLSLDFFFPGSFTNALMSFLQREPTTVNVQVLTDAKVLRFHYDFVQHLYQTSMSFNRLGRVIIEGLYIKRTKRELAFISQSAQQRYDSLFADNPVLIHQIPLKYLATYLGVKAETLSRIRRKAGESAIS